MKLPAFLFYPGDWLKDPALRACSAVARAAWIDLICLMWESEKRGRLVVNGRPLELKEVAKMVSTKAIIIRELELKGVLSRAPRTGIYFSRRMVRDERLRRARAVFGRIGGKQTSSKRQANGVAKGVAKGGSSFSSSFSSSSSSSSSSSGPVRQNNTGKTTGARGGEAGPDRTATVNGLAVRLAVAFGWTGDTLEAQRRAILRQAGYIVEFAAHAIDEAIELAGEKAAAIPKLDRPVAAWWNAMRRRYPVLPAARGSNGR